MPDVKVCLVGPQKAGKTYLFYKLTQKDLPAQYMMTIRPHSDSRPAGNDLNLKIHDLGGHPQASEYLTLASDAAVLLLVVDPFSDDLPTSLSDLTNSLAIIKSVQKYPPIHTQIVLTKLDLFENQDDYNVRVKVIKDRLADYTTNEPITVSVYGNSPDLIVSNIIKVFSMPLTATLAAAHGIRMKLKKISDDLNKKSYFKKTDPTRAQSITRLQRELAKANTKDDVKRVLINEARFIQTRNADGTYKYGINFFRFHFRSVEHSRLYQFIKQELKSMDPSIDLAVVSKPAVARVGRSF